MEKIKNIDLVVIGGGSAGLAAAISAKENGIDNILIIEKEHYLGGILEQCIHNGFGLQTFKEQLAGPEYAERFIKSKSLPLISDILMNENSSDLINIMTTIILQCTCWNTAEIIQVFFQQRIYDCLYKKIMSFNCTDGELIYKIKKIHYALLQHFTPKHLYLQFFLRKSDFG